MDLHQRRREMISLSDVEEGITKAYLTIKQRLRTIPERVLPQLISEKDESTCRELLLDDIDDTLLELSQLVLNILKYNN